MSAQEPTDVAGDLPPVAGDRLSVLAAEPEAEVADAIAPVAPASNRLRAMAWWLLVRATPVAAIAGLAAFLRFWQLIRVGFNSDEAVYSGTAASIAGDQSLRAMFPVFRAHPLLFQMLLALAGHGHAPSEWTARAVPAAIGVFAVLVTYLLANRMYERMTGLVAAAVLAVMPYHVVVSRQVLLDGLMTLLATVALYCVVRYAESAALRWLVAAGAVMGVTVLAKETSVVLLGGLYAFFALTPAVRMRVTHLLLAAAALVLTVLPFPVVLALSGRASTGRNYLLWQAFRRGNHGIAFYFETLPAALGPLVVIAALAGLVWLYRERTWRERLLLCWVLVPLAFFTLWPVKGYQYLLPVAPAAAVLAARTITRLSTAPVLRPPKLARHRWLRPAVVAVAAAVTLVTLAVPTWALVNPSPTGTFLAGTGGLPGGREAGLWVRHNVPAGAQLLAIGPSMANVLEFYGHRRVYALSVSSKPNDRNPAYVPVPNPDRSLRQGEFQYVVWDSYTAHRAVFFADETKRLVDKYHGVAVYTGTQDVRDREGHLIAQPIIIIYEVRA